MTTQYDPEVEAILDALAGPTKEPSSATYEWMIHNSIIDEIKPLVWDWGGKKIIVKESKHA